MKFTLSFTVVFTCVICYLLVPNVLFDWYQVLMLFLGGLLVSGSANAINQAVEKDTDAMMKRTANRPVAAGRMSQDHAYGFAALIGVAGIVIMYVCFNSASALLSAFSLILYSFVYTPLKKVNSIAVLVGALPGALPCLIGWVAGSGVISPFVTVPYGDGDSKSYYNVAGWALFGIQFLWQFPHFWAIAWIAHGDYSKAGFKLLPSDKGPTKFTALQSIMYTVLLFPVCVIPYLLGISGLVSFLILILANVFLLVQCIRLYINMDVKSARRVMFSSYIYLPIVFIALLADKI